MNKTSLLKKAFKSALYHEKWKKHGVDVESLRGYEGLRKIPYSSADDLREAWEKYPIEDIILTKNVGIWHCTSGSMGKKKWVPWTYNDYYMNMADLMKEIFNMGTEDALLRPDDIIFSIVLSAPFISGSLPYRILESTGRMGMPIEQIVMSPEYVEDSFNLLLKRQPTVIISTPSLVLRMAEEIAENTPKVLKKMAKETGSKKLRIASALTKIKKIKPKRVFNKLRLGFFVAEHLDPYRKAIEDLYGIEAFDLYGFTEGFGAGVECREHDGLHFPSANCILEIIPQSELEKEAKDPDYIPEAILLSEAEKGLVGELVVTDFKEALPLVRYRVRDLVKVVAVDECSCGQKSPRLKILGRTDDVINLGVIRFSSYIINQLLSGPFSHGSINKWEIYISRKGFKPKLTLRVEPEFVKNEEKFKKEIFNKLYSFNVFKLGFDNGLFIFDDIQFVSNLKLEIIGQGKSRRIRYDPNFLKPVKL
ncbi:MAG: phenylacetate--CoA ligase family protein [Candidatus Njordarchaeales archaeon]